MFYSSINFLYDNVFVFLMVDPEYLVKAVLVEQMERGKKFVPKDVPQLHKIFIDASQEFPREMSKFKFQGDYSITLGDVLWQLEQSKIFVYNGRGDGHDINYPELLHDVKIGEEVKGVVGYICDQLR